jgi:hypothetical protein
MIVLRPCRPSFKTPRCLTQLSLRTRCNIHIDHAPPLLGPSPPPRQAGSRSSWFFRPAFFCLSVSGGALFWAAYQTNKDTNKRIEQVHRHWAPFAGLRSRVTDRDLHAVRRNEVVQRAQGWLTRVSGWGSDSVQRLGIIVAEEYANLRESQRTCLGLLLVQTGVFLAWRVPRLQNFMARSFLHHPNRRRSYTLLTSVFSHMV